MENILINNIKGIHSWNKKAGLLGKSENRGLESSMLLEEVFEGLGIRNAKEEARAFITITHLRKDTNPVSDVAWLDHLCDLEFILHGSKAKIGLSPQQDAESTHAVLQANLTKLSVGVDSMGKQMKPSSWVGPEVKLQEILNKGIK